ncbi:hypothetical protein SELMODRAFT_404134 [Selaginella moellendorffii]|uniref:Uncharacterized protein WOX3-1 n=1 Tax=Selaginella moellendorffii TaxID=88036 RepID=D8QUD7_SELML|nr:hypothetical protein SELMODRAFT_404134 [Selaginella moellendorffii]
MDSLPTASCSTPSVGRRSYGRRWIANEVTWLELNCHLLKGRSEVFICGVFTGSPQRSFSLLFSPPASLDRMPRRKQQASRASSVSDQIDQERREMRLEIKALHVHHRSQRNNTNISSEPAPPRPVGVQQRWEPNSYQLQILEEFYAKATPPSPENIANIAELVGQVDHSKVYYWFSNKKSREKRKRRRLEEAAASASSSPAFSAIATTAAASSGSEQSHHQSYADQIVNDGSFLPDACLFETNVTLEQPRIIPSHEEESPLQLSLGWSFANLDEHWEFSVLIDRTLRLSPLGKWKLDDYRNVILSSTFWPKI